MSDITPVDLNLLRVLDVLLAERSVTRAAKRLSLTQSTVSGMLSRLRTMLGDPLFIRAQRGLVPTERALELGETLNTLLQDIESLLTPGEFMPAQHTATFAIAATDYAQCAVLAPLIEVLHGQAPGVRLAVLPFDHQSLDDRLAGRELDFALTTLDLAPQNLQSLHLYEERYVCAVRKGHPEIRHSVSLSQFCALGQVLVSPRGGGFRGPVDDALAARGRKRRVIVSVPSFLAVPRILQASDLIAVGPERLLIEFADSLELVPTPVKVPGFTLILAWHARTHTSAAHRWFRELVAQVAAVGKPRLRKK